MKRGSSDEGMQRIAKKVGQSGLDVENSAAFDGAVQLVNDLEAFVSDNNEVLAKMPIEYATKLSERLESIRLRILEGRSAPYPYEFGDYE